MENRSPYKTAAELVIEQWEYDGLVALVGPLSRDELGMAMLQPYVGQSQHPCGSAACIGGWVHHFAEQTACFNLTGPLKDLYLPDDKSGAYSSSSMQAARAIVNFLMTGNPQWDAVMAEPSP